MCDKSNEYLFAVLKNVKFIHVIRKYNLSNNNSFIYCLSMTEKKKLEK